MSVSLEMGKNMVTIVSFHWQAFHHKKNALSCYKTLMKVGLSQYNGSQAVLQVFEVSEKVGPDHTSEWALCISVRSC